MNELAPTDFLIAPPTMDSEEFSDTVIMIVNNTEKLGTIGLCVNKPLYVRLSDMINDNSTSLSNHEVYWGGPVHAHTLWMLHSADWAIENTIEVSPEWSVTSHESMFEEIDNGPAPQFMRLFVGYCAWDAGQLKKEIEGSKPFSKNNSWLYTSDVAPLDILDVNPDVMWEHACEIACAQAVDSIL